MHYVYVLHSKTDGDLYTGCTHDLRRRLQEHNAGKVISTVKRVPLELVYYEAYHSEKDAFRREKYLKTTYGHRYLRQRLRDYFTG